MQVNTDGYMNMGQLYAASVALAYRLWCLSADLKFAGRFARALLAKRDKYPLVTRLAIYR